MLVAAVRTAAFGVRAAYTVRYKPALAGTWLALNNAGFGANIATLCLALGTWYACSVLANDHDPSTFVSEAEVNVRLLRNCADDMGMSMLWISCTEHSLSVLSLQDK